MKIDPKVHTQRAVELKSKAQEELDAAGGERIAAKQAKADSVKFKDEYQQAKVAGNELLNEAAKLRADAAEKMKQAIGPRGTHAMANVVRGFASLMNKLAGQRLETTVSIKQDPEAKATAERMMQLASSKEAEGQQQLALATKSWAKATEALAKMEGHERTAAAHMAAAGGFMKLAHKEERNARLAETAQNIGNAVKSSIDSAVNEAKKQGAAFASEAKKQGAAFMNDVKDVGKQVANDVKTQVAEDLRDLKSVVVDETRKGLKDLLLLGAKFLTDCAAALEPAPVPAGGGRIKEAAQKAQLGNGGRLSDAEKQQIEKLVAEEGKRKSQTLTDGEVRAIKDTVKNAGARLNDDAKKVLRDFMDRQSAVFQATSNVLKTQHDDSVREKSFEPGRVEFGGGPRVEVKLPQGPQIDAPPKGEKKISESLLAARWAAEAEGIDWTKFSSTGELKKALASNNKNPLRIKNSSSPFEVKSRIAERLGLKDPKNLDVNVVRDLYAKREALGMSRLTPRAEFESAMAKLDLKVDAPIDQFAMRGVVKGQQALADAAKALKSNPNDVSAQHAFKDAATKLDTAKATMLDVLKATPKEDRRVLALDTVDAIEHGHGKPGTQAKLGHAVETLTKSGLFTGAIKIALGIDDATLDKAIGPALRASEWVSLGELKSSSSVLAYPGTLTDEQKKSDIFPLASRGVALAKDLELLDERGLETLQNHMSFKGGESVSAQMLGLIRQVAALSVRRDFRTKDQLTSDEILEELKKNGSRTPPSINPALIEPLSRILDDVVKALR